MLRNLSATTAETVRSAKVLGVPGEVSCPGKVHIYLESVKWPVKCVSAYRRRRSRGIRDDTSGSLGLRVWTEDKEHRLKLR